MSIFKRLIALFTALAFFTPCVFAQDFYETKNYIVVLDTPAVYSSERPVIYSADREASDAEYRNALLDLQNDIKNQINSGISFFSNSESLSYTELLNGFTMEMTEQKAEQVRNMNGVLAVIEDIIIPMQTPLSADALSQTLSSKLNSGCMINADKMHEKGYDGSGKAIAIIDSELDINHTYFESPDESYIKYTKQTITDIINSKSFIRSFSADDVYRSAKIPFAYNYAKNSTDVQPNDATIHGTHVTGIAAGSFKKAIDGTISGVAPEAQILFFGVFSNGGANPSNIFAAMDDAVKLGADTINLSLGEKWLSENYQASAPSVYWLLRRTIQNAKNAGISAVYAAGNFSKGNPESTDYIDYSTADNSTFPHALKAGSVNAEYVLSDEQIVQEYTTPTVSDFSSYGYSDTLDISVDFAAPGGGVYSSFPSPRDSTDDSAHKLFALMGGTSMAAPHISGAMVLMNQYIEHTFPDYTGANKENLARSLLASTAKTIYDENGTIASSRVVGSGLIDLDKATETQVFLTAENSEFSRITLGELSENVFTLKFKAHNLSNAPVTFDNIMVELSTDDYTEVNSVYKFNGLKKLNPSVSGDSSVTVPANGTATVSLTVTLDDEEINYLSTGFKNGFFIDGKVTLSESDNVPVGIPFTGFCGEWTKQPIISDFSKSIGVRGTTFNIDTPAIQENDTYVLYKSSKDLGFDTHMFIAPDRNCNIYFNQSPIFANKEHLLSFRGSGDYQVKLSLPGKNVSQTFNLSVREDSTPPSITITGESENDGEKYTTFEFSDAESAVSAVVIKHNGIDKPQVFQINQANRTLHIPNSYENLTVTIYDNAFNSTTLKRGFEIAVKDNICTIVNNTANPFSGLCMLAVYEGTQLKDSKILSDNLSLDIMGKKTIDVSAYSDKYYKIFCWSDDYSPVCEIYEHEI